MLRAAAGHIAVDREDDTRLVIERCQSGYLVTEFMGSKPLCAATEIDDALGFIKDKLEENTPSQSERYS